MNLYNSFKIISKDKHAETGVSNGIRKTNLVLGEIENRGNLATISVMPPTLNIKKKEKQVINRK